MLVAKENHVIGIIGGTGLYKIDGVSNLEKVSVNTPFGLPSSDIQIGLPFSNK